ncbi:MAG: zf-TFIIB domain-containing protein [Thermoplasmatales archaeon]|nr:zf-TFIIB domain-containing protein [Thermoplasmatales archaeon]MCK5636226.1 zf-TFIIB domain-containing protein [Thermoplasmatales archaeon]
MTSKNLESEKKYECHRCWVEMNKKEIEVFGPNIIIDICPKCNGIWLDKGELNKILKDRQLSDYLTKHIGTKSRSPMVCPRCGNTMDIEKAEDLEVDVCLLCGGVWLDEGELEDLKRKASDGYELDMVAKEEELAEEKRYKQKNSKLHRFIGKIKK